jgi:hypothetical protein
MSQHRGEEQIFDVLSFYLAGTRRQGRRRRRPGHAPHAVPLPPPRSLGGEREGEVRALTARARRSVIYPVVVAYGVSLPGIAP